MPHKHNQTKLPNLRTLTSLIEIKEYYSSPAAKFEFSKSKVLRMLLFSATFIIPTLTIILRLHIALCWRAYHALLDRSCIRGKVDTDFLLRYTSHSMLL